MGMFTGHMRQGRHPHSEQIFVITDFHHNLLGLPAITALQLISRVSATTGDSATIY